MAGLLDIFGTGGADTLGLLGMSPADIQRSRDDAQAQALYGLAGRLFQGGNTGASIAQGLQQGQQLYKQAMQDQLQEQLTTTKLQELQRKKKEEALAKALFMQGYQPAQAAVPGQEVYGEDIMGQRVGEGVVGGQAAMPAQFNLAGVAPKLMALGDTGQAYLKNALDLQKAMAGETFKLGEGEKQYQRDPMTGEVKEVAAAGPKREPVPSAIAEYNFAKDQGYRGTFQEFEMAKRAASAPKFAVDLKDPTAVAKAQADVVKDWRGVVKDTGAMEVADRFKAAKAAVSEANAGNKAADGALIYAIAKIYDPSGAVQEGDKTTIIGNRSIPQSIQGYAQKVFSGQGFLPEERAGLLSVANQIVQAKAKNLEAQKAPYVNISKQLGGSGDLLLNPLTDALTNEVPAGNNDLASQAAAILANRRKAR
jgi:hypothetical protein